jgi:hypothetical protein
MPLFRCVRQRSRSGQSRLCAVVFPTEKTWIGPTESLVIEVRLDDERPAIPMNISPGSTANLGS